VTTRSANALETPHGWTSFWFTPIDPTGLHVLRFLAGLLFLGWLLPLAGQQEALFGLGGWFDRQAYQEASHLPGGPPAQLGWSVLYLCGTSPTLLATAYWLAIAILVLFTLGIRPRITAVLAWGVVASFAASTPSAFDADALLAVLAFYLMVGYLLWGQWQGDRSLAGRLLGPATAWPWRRGQEEAPSYAANLAVRLLQVHFTLAVFVSGLHKLQFGDWWAGVAFWYPLHPPLTTTAEEVRAEAGQAMTYLFVLSLAQYALLAWQIGLPLFAWRRGLWRVVLLGGALVGWAGCLLLYKQPLFGPVYLIGCLSYLTPGEWARLRELLRRVRRPRAVGVVRPGRPVEAGVQG
jgi:hypothetical protein